MATTAQPSKRNRQLVVPVAEYEVRFAALGLMHGIVAVDGPRVPFPTAPLVPCQDQANHRKAQRGNA